MGRIRSCLRGCRPVSELRRVASGVSQFLSFSGVPGGNANIWLVVPWGRFMKIRKDLIEGSKSKTEGGTGIARDFWQWNEEQVKPFL